MGASELTREGKEVTTGERRAQIYKIKGEGAHTMSAAMDAGEGWKGKREGRGGRDLWGKAHPTRPTMHF